MAATSWVKLATTRRRMVALKILAPIAILTVDEVDTISAKVKEQIQCQKLCDQNCPHISAFARLKT